MKGGALLFVGVAGPRLEAAERALLARVRPAGVVLVQRNLADAESLRELVLALRAAAPGLILALDAEGGRVDRLRDLVGAAPAAADLARLPPVFARRAGRWVGGALAAFGFDLDLAPVVDLDRGRVGNALDRRCFGARPRAVVSRAGAFLDGLHAAGVGGCLKHFPGLGAAGEDTHLLPARIELDGVELAADLAPFIALATRSDAVMAGHAIYPGLDPGERPATLSAALCGTWLRRRVGFRGALLSDDLEMGALAPWGDLVERGRAALLAGCDGLLFCRQLAAAPEIASALGAPRLAERREAAAARLRRLRQGLAGRRAATAPPPAPTRIRAALAALAGSVAAATG